MASLIYNSFLDDLARGNIDMDTDTFKLMLVTSSYIPNKDTDLKRSAVTNEVGASGTYSAGGGVITCTVAKDTVNDRVTFTFGNISFTSATISAAGGVIYKSRGGLATADELVAYVDFGGTITSTASTFAVTFTNPLTLQN